MFTIARMSIYSVFARPAIRGVVELVRGGIDQPCGGHPKHWHSQWQLVAVTRGGGWVKTHGSKHNTPGGSLFLIPPEVVHSNEVLDHGCDFRSMLIEAEFIEGVARARGLRLVRSRVSRTPVLQSEKLTEAFDHFHARITTGAGDLALEEALETWISGLLCHHGRQTEEQVEHIAHPAARMARDLIADRATEPISLAMLAESVGLSRFELTRQFSAAYGMPPHAWQLQMRVDRGKGLLKSSLSLGEIALELGFSDQAHFNRVFKRSTGYTPGIYAKEFRKNIQSTT